MFNSCFHISKVRVKQTTPAHKYFFKRYRVFDGLGSFFFSTLADARRFARQRASLLESLFEYGAELFGTLSVYYSKRLLEFRCYKLISAKVNNLLSDSLSVLRYLSGSKPDTYMVSKVKHLFDYYLHIANLLNATMLYNTIKKKYDAFFIDYPVFDSSVYCDVKKMKSNTLKKKIV